MKDIRYALYARKSTDTEDKQVQSLDDQVKCMREIAKRNKLHIMQEIRESKSAKRPWVRPEFSKLLERIEKGEINGIICWKLDRLSRNPTDSGLIQQLLQDEKLRHIQAAERSYHPEDNAIVFSVDAGMSNQYIRELAVNTKRGMRSKVEKGDKPGVPPIGYLNDKLNKTIIPDPELFPLVRILWDKMLTGTYSIAQLVRIADEELHIRTRRRKRSGGNPIAYSSLCVMFKNVFYTGKLSYLGEEYRGNHKPMITETEFEKVQEIIDPKRATRPKDRSLEFLFRGLLVCGECGFAVTAEKKHKTIKSSGDRREYTYYHCTGKNRKVTCSQPHLSTSEDVLITQLKDKLSKFTICPQFYNLAIEALAEEEDIRVDTERSQTTSQDKAIERKKATIANLRRMRYSGEADDDTWYFSEMSILEAELLDLQKQRNRAERKARDWRATADDVFTFARYAKEDFDSDDFEKKRTVIARLGGRLELLDRTIQFAPNKYFVPIENMNEAQNKLSVVVRTNSEQIKTPTNMQVSLSWLRLLGSNQRPNR